MKQSPSKLSPGQAPVFLDASVLINLVATDCVSIILTALDRNAIIEETILREFNRDPRDGKSPKPVIDDLISKGLLSTVRMSEKELLQFLNLTGATPPDDLDDGEAATLACAALSGIAVIDERKATRIATKMYPALPVLCTLDLFGADYVVKKLGKDLLSNAVDRATKQARMRVPHHWKKWVCTLTIPNAISVE